MSTTIYTTATDYTDQVVIPALGDYAGEFNIDAIAEEMLVWHDEINEDGDIVVTRSGLVEDPEKDFWTVVQAHEA